MITFFRCSLLLCFAVSAVGCGEGTDAFKAARPKTVPASGKITYNGAALDGATIVLAPASGQGTAASAVSDSTGSFALSAFPGEYGAVPGTYNVSVTKMTDPPAQNPSEDAHDAPPAAVVGPKSLIPDRYRDHQKSGLEVDIPETGNESIVLELK